MLTKLLQDRIQIEKEISTAVVAELQKICNESGITIDSGMGSISFEQGSSVVYYSDVFNEATLNPNPKHPKSLTEFLTHRTFKNPYNSKAEAMAEYDEEYWNSFELKIKVAKSFYALVIQLDQHYSSDGYPALWSICGALHLTPQKS